VFREDVAKGLLTLGSIADAKSAFGDLDKWDIYRFCEARNWKRPLVEAFREMYLA
jgi:hypothetical protein